MSVVKVGAIHPADEVDQRRRAALVWLSLLAFAVGLGRTFLDWGIVFPEFGLSE